MAQLWICFEAHQSDGQVWAVREGNQWHRAREIRSTIPLTTVYRGPDAPQPKAYLRGVGVVRRRDDVVYLDPS